MTNDPQSWSTVIKRIKLILVIKVLFVIWLSAFLINTVSSSSGLYSIGSFGFKHFVYSISQSSGGLMAVSGLLLYPIFLLWCVLNYRKMKESVLRRLKPMVEIWRTKRETNRSKAEHDLKRKSSAKEWLGYACLFLAGMLLVDTFLYDSFLSLFRGGTQSQGMPKRIIFLWMLIAFHRFRSAVLIMFLLMVCVYVILRIVDFIRR